jgi:hypothetical protein
MHPFQALDYKIFPEEDFKGLFQAFLDEVLLSESPESEAALPLAI